VTETDTLASQLDCSVVTEVKHWHGMAWRGTAWHGIAPVAWDLFIRSEAIKPYAYCPSKLCSNY